ncbi:MAG TPA: ATP-binding protein [Trebonia sp.]|nr:ATP-binding protein [Trebonia sp.]
MSAQPSPDLGAREAGPPATIAGDGTAPVGRTPVGRTPGGRTPVGTALAGTAPLAGHPLFAGGLALVVTGAGLAWALAAATPAALTAVAAAGGPALAVTVGAVTVAAYGTRAARRSRAQAAAADVRWRRLEGQLADLAPARAEAERARRDAAEAGAGWRSAEAEAARLSGHTLPAAVGRVRQGDSAEEVLVGTARPASPALGEILDLAVTEIAAGEGRGATAMAACAGAAARIQAQSTRMLAELREMEQRHGDDKVFADLIELDHRVSQMGRLADSVALLAGGRSGRRWTRPIPMESILRGAMGRIDAYQRVRIHSTSGAAIAGYAAEGVMHALAELMDNATAFSTHGSEVHVYVEEEDIGVVVTIEDSGLGMRRRERTRAEGLVAASLDLATLPGTRLGLAVVGKVAARYGLSVSFRPSSRGGTGVVVLIPRALVTQARPEAGIGGFGDPEPGEPRRAPAASAGAPERDLAGGGASSATAGSADARLAVTGSQPALGGGAGRHAAPAGTDTGELPVRPRGQTLADASRARPPEEGQPAVTRTPQEAGSRFAAFRQAARGGADPGEAPAPRPDDDIAATEQT